MNVTLPTVEPLLTMKEVAARLNMPVYKVRRAVKDGLLPNYSPYNSRKLLRMSEVLAWIEASKNLGGAA
jgi:excisionase family DNA binding protein